VVAGNAARRAEADAEGRRIGARLGLGEFLGADDGSKSVLQGRIAAGILLVIMPWYAIVFVGLRFLVSPGWNPAAGRLGGIVILSIGVGIGTPLLFMLLKQREWIWLYTYEDGLAQVTGRRPASAVRWAELATMTLGVVQGYDGELITSCTLRDRAGSTVTVTGPYPGLVLERVTARAEQVLSDRLVGPLTSRLDAGLPATVGCLTVDRSGITCRGGRARNDWMVPWVQVQGVETRLHGHRVTVQTSRWRSKQAALGGPNDFLAGYALEHAARRAGVPFSAG
jgi:hypothetical protein